MRKLNYVEIIFSFRIDHHIVMSLFQNSVLDAHDLLLSSKCFKLALLYNFMSVYTNIPSYRQDESKTSFPLQERIFVYSRVFVL